MKINYIISYIISVLFISLLYYIFLPAINLTSIGFWAFLIVSLAIICFNGTIAYTTTHKIISFNTIKNVPKILSIPVITGMIIIISIIICDVACSPIFNAKSYANRITINEDGNFQESIKSVDFNTLPLLDRDSSEKLGDRVMGQMSELVSQYYVSDQYTQINYNNDIIRVTPLEYADLIKWITNRKNGIKGYITVNSVSGEAKLIKINEGMKYAPSAFFNDNLFRKLRFSYPTTIFGEEKFEIDNSGNPYWIVPTLSYTGVGLKTKVTGVIIFDPITGKSDKYPISEIPSWVDNAYYANLVIEQVDNWGTYGGGFLNSLFGQKNVVNTTDGYNYLAMDDDIYLYTGITSVLSDESNLGFILSNLRTGETTFYNVPGAEEYSAMASAEGQVQQMKYTSTFPLLINLNNKPTYLVSLKDAAGLVKMYGFIDVQDYQKVSVTDSSKGIVNASINYLNDFADEVDDNVLIKREITVKSKYTGSINGSTYIYIIDENSNKYKISLQLNEDLIFASNGDKISVGYYETNKTIIDVVKVY